MPFAWIFALVALAFLTMRSLQIWRALKFRMAISTKWLTTLQIPKLLQIQKRMKEEANSMYLGIGFEWTQKHCQIAHDILRIHHDEVVQPLLRHWNFFEREGLDKLLLFGG